MVTQMSSNSFSLSKATGRKPTYIIDLVPQHLIFPQCFAMVLLGNSHVNTGIELASLLVVGKYRRLGNQFRSLTFNS